MKKVFVANKGSYGTGFYKECDTLDELKREIVYHEIGRFSDSAYNLYSEELFKENSEDYILYEVDLHDDEIITFSEYDGQSNFDIEKKDWNMLSLVTRVK